MPTSCDKRLAYGAAIAAAMLMGTMGLFVRIISADAILIAFARLGLGFIFLVVFLSLGGNLGAAKSPISPCLVAGGLSLGFCVWSYIQAIGHTSLANAVFLLYLGPPLAAGLASLLLRERITLRVAALMGLAFLGCLFVLRFDFSFSRADALGYFHGVLAALGYALFIVMNRKLPPQVSPLGRSFYQLLIAALVLAPFLNWNNIGVEPQDLPWLVAVGFFQGFLCLSLMIFAIKHLTAYEYGILSYLEPAAATLIGVMVFAEPMTPFQVVGGGLIVLSGIAQLALKKPDLLQPD